MFSFQGVGIEGFHCILARGVLINFQFYSLHKVSVLCPEVLISGG